MKFEHVIFEIREQTDGQTKMFIAILCTAAGSKNDC